MKPTITAAVALMAGTALLYGVAHATPLTANNLMAHLAVESDAVPHAVGATPSTMRATYTVSNPTNESIRYPQRGLAVDWKIVDSQGAVVYDVNLGKITPHIIALRILRPNEHQDYLLTVSLQDQTGAPLSSGKYVLQACLIGVDNLQTNKSFSIK